MFLVVFFLSLVVGIFVDILGLAVGLQFGSIFSISIVGAFIVFELKRKK